MSTEKRKKSRTLLTILFILVVIITVLLVINGRILTDDSNIEETSEKSTMYNTDESQVITNDQPIIENEVKMDINESIKDYVEDDHSHEAESGIDIKQELNTFENKYNVNYLNEIQNLEKAMFDLFVANERITNEFDEKYINDLVNNEVMAILRKDRYFDDGLGMDAFFWGTIAGSTDPYVKGVLKLLEDDLELSLGNVNSNASINGKLLSSQEITAIHELMIVIKEIEKAEDFVDPVTGETIDFIHMMASLDSLYTDIEMDQGIEAFVDYLAGWAGDLKTFLPDLLKEIDTGNLKSNLESKNFVKSLLGSTEKSHFSLEDLLADIDAININTILKSDNLLLSEGIIWYYNSREVEFRYSNYVNSFGGVDEFNHVVRIMLFYSSIDEHEIETFDFTVSDLVGVLELFEDIFKHREVTNEELVALYEGFTELIIDRKKVEEEN